MMWKVIFTGIFSLLLAPVALGNVYLHFTQGRALSWGFIALAGVFVFSFVCACKAKWGKSKEAVAYRAKHGIKE